MVAVGMWVCLSVGMYRLFQLEGHPKLHSPSGTESETAIRVHI